MAVGSFPLITHTYAANNGNLIRSDYGNGDYYVPTYDSLDRIVSARYNEDVQYYISYGADGRIGLYNDLAAGVTWRYEYAKDGSVTSAICSNGTRLYYTCDTATGNLISITGSLANTVGVKNPYRYRGYRYDTETGLYYLQSRYYDPEIKRFINADGFVSTVAVSTATILSAPILATIGIGAAAGAVASTTGYAIQCSINNQKIDARKMGVRVATGAVFGAASAGLASFLPCNTLLENMAGTYYGGTIFQTISEGTNVVADYCIDNSKRITHSSYSNYSTRNQTSRYPMTASNNIRYSAAPRGASVCCVNL